VWTVLQLWQANPSWQPDQDPLPGHVNVMTCHAAKGLEFPVVLVAWTDLDRVNPPGNSLIGFDPQPPCGFGLMLNQHEDLPSLKGDIYQTVWSKPRLYQERQRLFYVAISRAKERLYIYHAANSAEWVKKPS
jgi:superfamily I DNA/RNA helicase